MKKSSIQQTFLLDWLFQMQRTWKYMRHILFPSPFCVSNGIELRYSYTDSRILSCKAADSDEIFIFLQN